MALEIERKFLVKNMDWKSQGEGVLFKQGFLNTNKERTVRVRVKNNIGILTIKGLTQSATRVEYEYEIPYTDAVYMLDYLCEKPIIEKHRYLIEYHGRIWEVDEFHGENKGLIVAEIELSSEEEAFEKPSWVGKEVTHDPRYYNSNLVQFPYCRW